jgi:hypothetical protein
MVNRLALATAAGFVVVTALIVAGCGGPVVGSGNLVTRQYDFKSFTRLEVSHAFEVQITRGDTFKVEVTVDDNIVDRLRVEQNGATVKIGMESGISFGTMTRRAVVVLPDLEAVSLSGASQGSVAGFDSRKDLDVGVSGASDLSLTGVRAADTAFDVSGASKVAGDLQAGAVRMEASGASQITLQGSGVDGDLEASGASKLVLSGFELATADVTVSGASSASVNVARTLDADASGASTIEYSGNGTIRNIQTSGASQVNRRE